MQFRNFDELMKHIKNTSSIRTLAVAAAHDEHCLDAVVKARDEGFISPLLIGDKVKIVEILSELGATVSQEQIIHEINEDAAAQLAVQLVREGKADFLMKGKLNTANMLRPIINRDTGLVDQDSTGVISLFAISEIPAYHKLLAFSDSGIIVNPTLEQKKGIIIDGVRTLRAMGFDDPNVAVMAAVETLNPKMPECEDGAALAEMNRRGEIKDCVVEGPISMDLAFDSESARIKGYQGKISGNPDFLVWPNLVSGNLAGKALNFFANATTISFAVGATVPLVITSRGATTDVKYMTIAIAASVLNAKRDNPY